MKKTFLVTGLLALLYAGPVSTFYAVAETNSNTGIAEDGDWKKAKNATWPGKDGMWYKIDGSGRLSSSKDGKKWESVPDGMWQDKEGKWLKIKDNQLVWSSDGGASWEEVPDRKWKAADGKWYKFDKDWMLWVKD